MTREERIEALARRMLATAYKQGWNDRESDILERAESMGLPDPIPAAAALLREAGWKVEEPKPTCPECGQHDWHAPTCNGTGARP